MDRDVLQNVRSVVVKVGSGVLVREGLHFDRGTFCRLVELLSTLVARDFKVALVSSGAVALGRNRMAQTERPDRERSLPLLQALAAIGQTTLMQLYDSEFAHYQLRCGQVLLTRDDLDHRTRYLNARRTMLTLWELGVIPVINENDTLAHDEIRFGDNDRLAARVANLLEAELLVIFSDVDALYTANPRLDPDARPLHDVEVADPALDAMVSDTLTDSGGVGTGGMITKLEAARVAAKRSIPTLLLHGKQPELLLEALAGQPHGTLFVPSELRRSSRKAWIETLRVHGQLVCDPGAVRAISQKGKSLLPSGITRVDGRFLEGDAVEICGPDGVAIARGLSMYPSVDVQRICGHQSSEIVALLGYQVSDAVVHRDDLVLLDGVDG